MESSKRPAAVTLLSLIAFAFSPILILVLAFFFLNIYARNETPSFGQNPGGFVFLAVWELILSICFFLLAWLSYLAGRDLWKLRERGRHLALFSMPLFLVIGGLATANGNGWWTATGTTICILSVFFFIYLLLPSVRGKFRTPVGKSS
jgi:hypothetical protein